MFVFKNNKLIRQVEKVSNNINRISLSHPTTATFIRIDFPIDMDESKDLLLKSYKSKLKTRATSPYVVFRLDSNGKYSLYKEIWDENKTVVQNFQDAINFFEESIYEKLNEQPPQQQPPQPRLDDDENEGENEGENESNKMFPKTNDIIKINNNFKQVLSFDSTTKEAVLKDLTEEQAMKILRNRRNAEIINKRESTGDDDFLSNIDELE